MFKKVIIPLIILALLVGCSTPNEKPKPSAESSLFQVSKIENVKVTSEELNIRSGIGTNFRVIGVLKKNDIVNVVGQSNNWYIVQLSSGLVGCIEASFVMPVVLDNNKAEISKVYRLTSQEEDMINLVNKERVSRNLPPLQIDLELTRVARTKAQDMVNKDYFSHFSPTYGSPFSMMKNFGIEFLFAGENLAGNTTVEKAHNALMNSEGHKANILSSEFTHIGIGVQKSDKYGNIFCQMFVYK